MVKTVNLQQKKYIICIKFYCFVYILIIVMQFIYIYNYLIIVNFVVYFVVNIQDLRKNFA